MKGVIVMEEEKASSQQSIAFNVVSSLDKKLVRCLLRESTIHVATALTQIVHLPLLFCSSLQKLLYDR
jgi:hypothetical protein